MSVALASVGFVTGISLGLLNSQVVGAGLGPWKLAMASRRARSSVESPRAASALGLKTLPEVRAHPR